jgi:hypothetical protein
MRRIIQEGLNYALLKTIGLSILAFGEIERLRVVARRLEKDLGEGVELIA